MPSISREFLTAIPKTDLHVHLDGSVRPSTLIELARECGTPLPSYTDEGLCELVFKLRYDDLVEYLRCFQYTVAVLQTEVALERVAFELAEDSQAEGVRYIEVRYAPHLHTHKDLDPIAAMEAVNRGLRQAQRAFNQREAVRSGAEPPFEYGIIIAGLRMFQASFSEYYANLFGAHRFAPARELYALATLELARAGVEARDRHGVPIVALDLAGQERGYPPSDHVAAYQFAHRHFLCKTVHAGEAYGPESIFQAITELHADRIGHGSYLLDTSMISDPEITDPKGYVGRLSQYIADRRITIEVCLSSNFQTMPHLTHIGQHPARQFRDEKLSITLCTDNRTVSRTSVTNELALAVEHLGFTRDDIKNCVIYGFKRSFFPRSYLQKRSYVRCIIDYYEEQERRFLGSSNQPVA